jgi:2-methylcitrate dehydratase PrpD
MRKRIAKSAEVNFARFAVEQTFESLPPAVVERAKEIFLDTLGIMLRATSAPGLSNLREALVDRESGASTVLGTAFKAHPSVAALLNASLPTVTQYDEGHRVARGHPGIHIVPAAFAVGEDKRIAGKDLIVAIVTGYEVAARIGLCVSPMDPRIHPHGNWAAIGAAVSVGKILSFSEGQFVDLINSISNLTLSTWRRAVTAGATIHHLSSGFGASHAIVVALAVQAGLSGPPSCLEEYYIPLSSTRPNLGRLTEGLGSTYEILNNYFKPYPACAHIHSSIEALERILASHPISVEEVEWVEVRTFAAALHLNEEDPPNTLAGIFSIPYCLAMILVKRKLLIESIAKEAPMDPQLLKVASRIRVVKDEDLRPHYPEGRPSLVRVHLKNGTEYEDFVGLPRERPTAQELGEKFLQMVEPLIGKKRGEELRRKIEDFENISNVGQLSKYLPH